MGNGTSIGPGPERGGNQDRGNADGRGNKTLGEHDMPEPEAGLPEGVEGAPDVPRQSPESAPESEPARRHRSR